MLPDRIGLLLGRDPHLGLVADRLAAAFGDRPLVEQAVDQQSGADGLTLTYRQAAAEVTRLAASIAAGAGPGERVVVAVPNGYRSLLLCLAAARAGCVAVPVDPQGAEPEVDHVAGDCGASLVLRADDDLPRRRGLAPARAVRPDDVAALFYTAGTTGPPKRVRLTHRALAGTVRGVGLPRWLRADEAVLGLPVASIYGFSASLELAAVGIPAYFLPQLRPVDALDSIEERRPSMFLGVPATYRLLLEAGAEQRDLSSIRAWISGTDVMPARLARTFQRLGASVSVPYVGGIGEATFVDGYGMVELGGVVAVKVHPPLAATLVDRGGLGLALPGWELQVPGPRGEVGELLVRGPGTMLGYDPPPEGDDPPVGPPEWVPTGDLARRGPLGTVTLIGRAADVIEHHGVSVHPIEVEGVLERHEAVAEAAVVGLPGGPQGARVVAAVRLGSGTTLAEEDLLRFARLHLSPDQVPERVRLVDHLPRTATQKVPRARLRGLFA